MIYAIEKDFLPDDIAADSKRTFKERPTHAVIHWIGPYPNQNAKIVRNWWKTSGQYGSAHFVIKDSSITQCWPLDKVAWHCSNFNGNLTTWGIEIIPKNKEGEFSDESIETCKWLLKHLGVTQISRHYDWNRKMCPLFYCTDDKWAMLKERLGYGR